VTSRRPSTATLERAMGYYCPDDPNRPGWCAPEFAGFFNQVMNASAQFQRYRLHPNSFAHRVGTQQVRYHPNPGCGGRSVTIKNAATAGLYNYTPYTPNRAAMNNLFGVGDSCSAYGNRNFWRIYNEWFGSPTGTVSASATITRLAGADRYGTSVAIAKDTFPSGAPVVYVAVGSSFPDGLSAAPAAVRAGGPLLLTPSNDLPAAVYAEIQRLQPQRIVVVGGPGAVSDDVFERLSSLAPEIRRDAGGDRYLTADAVARAGFPSGATIAFVASGGDFPDALSASAAAGALSGPVVLVPPGSRSMPEHTRELLRDLGVRSVVIVGGTGVLPDGSFVDSIRSVSTVTSVSRQAGANRYSTSAAINAYAFPTATTAYVASGRSFPDALSAAAAAGTKRAALHLSPGTCLPVSSAAHLASAKVSSVLILGGNSVIANPPQSLQPCR
jgi:putative cell wall-binding protein